MLLLLLQRDTKPKNLHLQHRGKQAASHTEETDILIFYHFYISYIREESYAYSMFFVRVCLLSRNVSRELLLIGSVPTGLSPFAFFIIIITEVYECWE